MTVPTGVPGPSGDGAGARPGRGVRVVHTVLRAVFAVALAVIIALIVIRVVNTSPSGAVAAASSAPTGTSTPSVLPVQTSTSTPTPTASSSASPAAVPSLPQQPSQPQATTSTKPTFTSFESTESVECPVPPAGDVPFSGPPVPAPTFTISWASKNADQAYIGAETSDASAEPYSEVDTTGSFDYEYVCPQSSVEWTVTLVGADGSKVSKTAHISNDGYTG